jgi:hypothetical protein
MSSHHRALRTSAAVALTALAAASSAAARPADFRDQSPAAPKSHVAVQPVAVQPPVQVVHVSDTGGFDWGDAGIGAGGALAAVLLILGGVTLIGHRRDAVGQRSAVA